MQPPSKSRCAQLLHMCLLNDIYHPMLSLTSGIHAESKCGGIRLHSASPTEAICCPSTDAASNSSGVALSPRTKVLRAEIS